ncbi:4Fe-4S binding protein [candidate division WOR-3 bacterium]|nr:4Fe-4S binding protein [candidate division WOR-3 bacterium]
MITGGKTDESGEQDIAFHFVCTREEARDIIAQHDRFWVEDCGCRIRGSGCKRSRIDVCLYFDPGTDISGEGLKEVDKEFVEGILVEAEVNHLVSQPFRYREDKSRILGICFCCDDCCEYILDEDKKSDKGRFQEHTDLEICSNCGNCVEVCYFNVRKMSEGILVINQEGCWVLRVRVVP